MGVAFALGGTVLVVLTAWLIASGHAMLSIATYLAAGTAWLLLYMERPPFHRMGIVRGGKGRALMVVLWPLLLLAQALDRWGESRRPDRFSVCWEPPDRDRARSGHLTFGNMREALAFARTKASELGSGTNVTLHDGARLRRAYGEVTFWMAFVKPDGSVDLPQRGRLRILAGLRDQMSMGIAEGRADTREVMDGGKMSHDYAYRLARLGCAFDVIAAAIGFVVLLRVVRWGLLASAAGAIVGARALHFAIMTAVGMVFWLSRKRLR